MRISDLYRSTDELALIQAAQTGSQIAQERLLCMHEPYIRMIAGRMKTQDCVKEELFQAGAIGFLHAVKHFECSRENQLLAYASAWIIGEMKKALRTFCLDRTASCSLEENTEEALSLEETLGQEEAGFSNLELHMAIDALDPDEQRLVLLRFFRDKTQKETAVLLSRSQSAVSKLEQKALDHLRSLLSELPCEGRGEAAARTRSL